MKLPKDMNPVDSPLQVRLEKGQLIISIGINTMADSVFRSPTLEQADYNYRVTDAEQFTKDLINAMEVESEDGDTPLNHFLDDMAMAAIDEGSPAVEPLTLKDKIYIFAHE